MRLNQPISIRLHRRDVLAGLSLILGLAFLLLWLRAQLRRDAIVCGLRDGPCVVATTSSSTLGFRFFSGWPAESVLTWQSGSTEEAFDILLLGVGGADIGVAGLRVGRMLFPAMSWMYGFQSQDAVKHAYAHGQQGGFGLLLFIRMPIAAILCGILPALWLRQARRAKGQASELSPGLRRTIPRWVWGVAGAAIGLQCGHVVWLIISQIVVPKGPDFTGYFQSLAMLLLLPFFWAGGAIGGARLALLIVDGKKNEAPILDQPSAAMTTTVEVPPDRKQPKTAEMRLHR